MKLSVVMCSLINQDKTELTKKCLRSINGADEVILFTVLPKSMGYCESWNTAVSLATGDYILCMSDDHEIKRGDLKSMCIPDTVVCPSGNDTGTENYWGGMFCVPRNIYEKYGFYDMRFNEGIHYMDTDLFHRYVVEGVKMVRTNEVEVAHHHPGYTLSLVEGYGGKVDKNRSLYYEKWQK